MIRSFIIYHANKSDIKSLLWAWISNKKQKVKEGIKNMTIEQAQDIVSNQGFAWTVTEIIEGDSLNLIYCDWKGKEHLMYYSNNQKKICRIE